MGSRGPAPLPANVHMLRGNRSKKPLDELLDSLQPEIEIPSCPRHLLPEARKEWRRITPELERYGLISKLDRAALALYCQAWARMVYHEEQLQRAMKIAADKQATAVAAGEEWKGGDGFMLPTPNGGWMYSPHWVAAQKASDQVLKYQAQFGLSPSSRGRVNPSNNAQRGLFEDDKGNTWSDL